MVVSGLAGVALTAIIAFAVAPQHPVGAVSVFARAIACVGAIFTLAAIPAYFALGAEKSIPYRKDIAFRSAMVAAWLPPLLMFSEQGSWVALLLGIVVVIEATQLVAIFAAKTSVSRVPSPETSSGSSFAVLKQDQPYTTSIVAVFMMQGAIVAGLADHIVLAGLLYLSGTAALAHRCYRMFREVPSADKTGVRTRTLAVLAAATFLLVFAWLPYLTRGDGGSGGDSLASGGPHAYSTGDGPSRSGKRNRGQGDSASLMARLRSFLHPNDLEGRTDSFSAAKQILRAQFPKDASEGGNRSKKTQNTKIVIPALFQGPGFPGVELYPEVRPVTKLVAPSLSSQHGVGTAHDDPLSIPFNGVYWLWLGPSSLPPTNSVVMHGSPSAQFFHSADGEGMSMEAKQNLGFAVRPELYGSIEIDIQNADPFPDSVNILLKVRNTRLATKPAQWLGMKEVSTAAEGMVSRQTLRFPIPANLVMGTFDELTVTYYLKGARVDRSARIAIDRFRLVPRRG